MYQSQYKIQPSSMPNHFNSTGHRRRDRRFFTVDNQRLNCHSCLAMSWLKSRRSYWIASVGFDGVNAIELTRCYVQKNLDRAIDYIKSRRDKCTKRSRAIRNPDGSIKYWKPSRKWKQFNTVLNRLYAKRREQMKLFAYTIAHWLERHYDKVLYGDYIPFTWSVRNGLEEIYPGGRERASIGLLGASLKPAFAG